MAESFLVQQAREMELTRAEDLRRVSLFVELNLDADEIARSAELFAQMVRKYHRSLGPELVVQKFPALTLTTLIGHAGMYYDRNRYWDSFWEELDLARDLEFEKVLREELESLLSKFGLRRFPELDGQYVQAMAVHAGIPVHCLDDLVDVIDEHIAAGRDANGAAVVEWLTEPGMGYRLNRLDVPVRNFLRLGGEVAVDIVDRIIEFAAYFAEHPEAANDLDLDTATTGLPNLLLDALIDRLAQRPLGSGPREPAAVVRTRNPVVAYSSLDQQVVVEVPYPVAAPESPWRVSFDGAAHTVYAERAWGTVEGQAQPATPVPVPRPVRQIVLAHESLAEQVRIPLVDKDDPLLLFDESGRSLSRHLALPRGAIIAVCPHDTALLDTHTQLPMEPVDEQTPVGWSEWRARVYDLTEAGGVRWRRGNLVGPVRQVRAGAAARLELGAPVEGVTTRNGLSVYGERPAVALPATSEPTTWRVRTRRAGTVDWLTDEEWESGDEATELDPFDGVASGLLGMFDVVVSGPLGSDLRHSLFLAEGLDIGYTSEFRKPAADGLTPTSCTVTACPPLSVDTTGMHFAGDVRDAELRVAVGGDVERLSVRPPHIEIRVDGIGGVAQWRTTAAALTIDQLDEHATVAARIPGDVQVDIALVDRDGEVLQLEQPQVVGGNVFQVPTRAFLDTARTAGVSSLLARIDTPDGATHHVTLARVRPPVLCTGVRVADGCLLFDGATGADLAASVWADTAPWREPEHVAIENGRASLPQDLIDAGPLTVEVFVDDPWSVTQVPDRPGEDALSVSQPGWFTDPDPVRTELSRFLSGHGPAPAHSAAVPEVWAALTTLPENAGPMRATLYDALATDPRSALETLAQSTIPQEEHPALLIASGLIERDFASPVRAGAPENPWIGCLLDIADLPAAADDRGSATWQELLARLTDAGGERLRELLSGKVGDPREGIFDRSAAMLHGFDAEQVHALKVACEIVPAALLDTDTRTSAMFEAFERRLTWQNDPARLRLTTGTRDLLAVARRASRPAYDQVVARNEALAGIDTSALPWMLMSMQSLLLAVVARLTARGRIKGAPISPGLRADWATLARLCPSMVCTDLLIADALVTYGLHRDLIGEPL
ncbi:hypothetical protein [Nocardia higoensis]|uniref:hypothetical protein n=1 Tax=Nocardia higoensis TaxID=228599 RepID=UPI0002D6C0DA|nr:hypothetical protein [Nocardia higoensis]